MKRLFLICLSLFLCLSLFGCAAKQAPADEQAPAPDETTSSEQEEKDTVTVYLLDKIENTSLAGTTEITFVYDKQGREIAQNTYDLYGALTNRYEITYDEAGRIATRTTYGTATTPIYQNSYRYNDSGNVTRLDTAFPADPYQDSYIYTSYTADGKKDVEKTNMTTSGRLTKRVTYTYNEDGYSVHKEEFAAGVLTLSSDVTSYYDKNDNLLKVVNHMKNTETVYRYVFGEKGNVLEQICSLGDQFITHYRLSYDDAGRLYKLESLLESGEVQSTATLTFAEHGGVIEKKRDEQNDTFDCTLSATYKAVELDPADAEKVETTNSLLSLSY